MRPFIVEGGAIEARCAGIIGCHGLWCKKGIRQSPYGDLRRKKAALRIPRLVKTLLVPTVVIPLTTLFQLPEERLVLVCKWKFAADVGQKTVVVFGLTSSMLKIGAPG